MSQIFGSLNLRKVSGSRTPLQSRAMTRPRSSTVLLLVFPLVLLCSPPASAHRVLKGGCLNYGHSCLGAHGKRAYVPVHPPVAPRPLLDVLLDALNTPTRSSHYSHARAANSVMGPRASYPEGRVKSPPTSDQLSDMGLDLRGEDYASGTNDDLESVGAIGGVRGSLDDTRDLAQDNVLYYGVLNDDYSDARYKRSAVSLPSRGRLGASPPLGVANNAVPQDRPHILREEHTGKDEMDPKYLALASFPNWLRR
ncbi:uncharacterized protein LOC121874872 isoform X2 [Homarus americanus]|uniref:uncharacterized protein LOC121874872 isoform X2 n=1 Tax=Homarus americanus TaxID=6706 RepID=UPI001C49456E|nr:uncharacterized protein LOC121874872 isoform X2 [Homarus americanus]